MIGEKILGIRGHVAGGEIKVGRNQDGFEHVESLAVIDSIGGAQTMGGSECSKGCRTSFGIDERVDWAQGELEFGGRSLGGSGMILVKVAGARLTTMVLG